MKGSFIRIAGSALLFLVLLPAGSYAESSQSASEQPPIAQPLVREGDFAIQLVTALSLGAAVGEAEAESVLGNAGIAPRNGWIADYPVTPDIIGELSLSISTAAESGTLKMGKSEALQAFQNVTTGIDLSVRAGMSGQTVQKAPGASVAPNAGVINNYYYDQGPPAVTYYTPPQEYIYLYAWVPYPFWWWDFWFPGYYILSDFHRVVYVRDRHDHDRFDRDRRDRVKVISNHFVDHRANKVVRIDPVMRYNGRTSAGIGAPRDARRYISPGARGRDETIFRGAHEQRDRTDGRRIAPPPSRGDRDDRQPRGGGGGDKNQPQERRER